MFCKNCGKEIDDNVAFCPNCGTAVNKPDEATPVAEVAPVAEATPVATSTNDAVTDSKAKNKKTNVYALIGFVLSICTWIVFSFLNYRVYVCTAVGGISLAFSIVGLVVAEKKNYNFKSLAIAGLIVSVVAVLFWPLTTL